MPRPIANPFTKEEIEILKGDVDCRIPAHFAAVSHFSKIFQKSKLVATPAKSKTCQLQELYGIRESTDDDYMYMVTFTIDPKKPHNVDDIEAFIHRQPLRSEFRTKSAYIVKEYTKAGQAHWHMSIITGKSLRNDAFKFYREKYGSVDKRSSIYNNQTDALLYMSKQGEPIKIV